MKAFGFIAVVITGTLLLYAEGDLPRFGDPDSPASQSGVSTHYIEKTYEESHVPNLVTAVLADYRSYDTMFETVVIFTAGISIFAILGGLGSQTHRKWRPMPEDKIIRMTCRILAPIIQVFALYVLMNGHYSPGGGFQGGVIFAASFILLAISGDLDLALKRLSSKKFLIIAAFGIIFYAGHGIASMLLGGNFLEYGVLAPDAVQAHYWGILGVEIGVFLTVTTIMFGIYAALSTRGALKRGL
ncbi:MAG: multicomponent Na+:H+ antiporter subunit B [Verrucomicrobiales bacterium]|jgi:multicomponent Na+:H+ antiporter subunit B